MHTDPRIFRVNHPSLPLITPAYGAPQSHLQVILHPIDTISLYHRMDTYCSLDTITNSKLFEKYIDREHQFYFFNCYKNEWNIDYYTLAVDGRNLAKKNPKVCINRPKCVNEIYKNFCQHSIYILSLSNIIFLVKQNTLNANIWSAFVSFNCRLLLYNILNLINWFVHKNEHWYISAKISHATHFHAVRVGEICMNLLSIYTVHVNCSLLLHRMCKKICCRLNKYKKCSYIQ